MPVLGKGKGLPLAFSAACDVDMTAATAMEMRTREARVLIVGRVKISRACRNVRRYDKLWTDRIYLDNMVDTRGVERGR